MPAAAVLEAQGLTPADYDVTVEVWPENWPAWCLWQQVRGQWRVGVAGVYALDYVPLFALMERMRLPDDEWRTTFEAIRVIEATAIDEMKAT